MSSAVHTDGVQASVQANLIDAKFQASSRKVARRCYVHIVLEIVPVVLLGRPCRPFARLVVPMACSPEIEGDATPVSVQVSSRD